jgi:hypothetical protein
MFTALCLGDHQRVVGDLWCDRGAASLRVAFFHVVAGHQGQDVSLVDQVSLGRVHPGC